VPAARVQLLAQRAGEQPGFRVATRIRARNSSSGSSVIAPAEPGGREPPPGRLAVAGREVVLQPGQPVGERRGLVRLGADHRGDQAGVHGQPGRRIDHRVPAAAWAAGARARPGAPPARGAA
jgi:hypothetical protein